MEYFGEEALGLIETRGMVPAKVQVEHQISQIEQQRLISRPMRLENRL
ncbi:hypothetical protein Desdi_1620 [Desulfitobacterium dichloroeliminans LMG P-21439]|uniref:Uncharacterized protein n=1 Tax=Desulfitobacterium dichloroeliminans (strain LMG P-21439 / DCA1) TaxID=871963 RepID=L0F8Z3_DESDL|nr:hypothetical protein Desdi_1620 [Desulfitobacterium dichloroeliminans LMG P-21439]